MNCKASSCYVKEQGQFCLYIAEQTIKSFKRAEIKIIIKSLAIFIKVNLCMKRQRKKIEEV